MRYPRFAAGIPISVINIRCQRYALQVGGSWRRGHHVTSVTARWLIVKGVLSKWPRFLNGRPGAAITSYRCSCHAGRWFAEDKLAENVPSPVYRRENF